MRVTKEEFIKLLDDNNIVDMDIEMSLSYESIEDREKFFTDTKMRYSNERIYQKSRNLLRFKIKTYINNDIRFIGFSR